MFIWVTILFMLMTLFMCMFGPLGLIPFAVVALLLFNVDRKRSKPDNDKPKTKK